MKKRILLLSLLVHLLFAPVAWSGISPGEPSAKTSVDMLLGESLEYNVSFLWFKKIARGEIRLEAGTEPGTYLATLTAKTRGLAAFFTSNRVETYTTLMEEGPDGLLRPLLQTAETQKSKGGQVSHRQTCYRFDFSAHRVIYRKTVDGVEQLRLQLPMDSASPTYDFLTAFYNLRLGRLGPVEVGQDIKLTAFSRKGPEELVISRVVPEEQSQLDFADELLLCKVLMSPETFKSKRRDVYVGFDVRLRPLIAVVKDVIGLGDVRGELVRATDPGRMH